MPLIDLSMVTYSIVELLNNSFKYRQSVYGNNPGAVVSPDPPDMLKSGLCFYLYHAQENSKYKNLPAVGNDVPPVRYVPLSLDLYYILTAQSPNEKATAYDEQKWMGCAMKMLHDYPLINDSTQILIDDPADLTDLIILDSSLRSGSNYFKISLQPIPYAEAVHYWTAGQKPLRMAAYYEVSVILIDAEQPITSSSRVLSYNMNVLPMGTAQISGNQSTLTYSLPGSTTQQQIISQPAQASPPSGQVIFNVSGFSGGDEVQLLLQNSQWSSPVVITKSMASWQLALNSKGQLSVTIQDKVPTLQNNETTVPVFLNNGTNVTITPGMYTAQMCVIRNTGNAANPLINLSGQSPFVITPYITTAAVNSVITVAGSSFSIAGWSFPLPSAIPPVQLNVVQVYVGSAAINYASPAGVGQFEITTANILTINLPHLKAGLLPLKIIVSGAECAPIWINLLNNT